MEKELLDQQVLAMYDVRGIQSYIFKSNAAKEIVGASALVEKIITEGLQAYVRMQENGAAGEKSAEQKTAKAWSRYMTDWTRDDPNAFLENPEVEMQIMFIGGGNAYVLFRHGSECAKVNRFLAKYLLDRTYSLNLAVAVVKRTESYADDYESINNRLREIKASMPLNMPIGALPFMAADSITGAPLTHKDRDGNYYSTEASLKRAAFPKQEDEKIFDNMVTEKGSSSTLAVFHIDGNSMGNTIKTKMEGKTNYGEAVKEMRNLSKQISGTFRQTVDEMRAYMDSLTPKIRDTKDHKLYREIIVAGDDITFVCNAKLAIPAVKFFLENISKKGEFSACGGIAFFNSHFPFSDAYQIAEACCESAKKRAKQAECKGTDNKIGNFLDYQICTNIRASELDAYRDRHYMVDGKSFIFRPYYVPFEEDKWNMNGKNDCYNISKLIYWLNYFAQGEKSQEEPMARSKAKKLRDTIPMGVDEINSEISFLESRGYAEPKKAVEEVKKTAGGNDREAVMKEAAIWYDALEIMDWLIKEDE